MDVKAVTWDKDSHGLFDYEHSHHEISHYKIKDSQSYFVRKCKNTYQSILLIFK